MVHWEHDDRGSPVTSALDQHTAESDQNTSPRDVHRRGRGRFSALDTQTLYCEAIPAAPRFPETPRRKQDTAGAAGRMARGAFAGLGRSPVSASKSSKKNEMMTPTKDEAPKARGKLVKKKVIVLSMDEQTEVRTVEPNDMVVRRTIHNPPAVEQKEEESSEQSRSRRNRRKKNHQSVTDLPAVGQQEVKADTPIDRYSSVSRTVSNAPSVLQKEAQAVHAKTPEKKFEMAFRPAAEFKEVKAVASSTRGDTMQKFAGLAVHDKEVTAVDAKKFELVLRTITNLPPPPPAPVEQKEAMATEPKAQPAVKSGVAGLYPKRRNWGDSIMSRIGQSSH